MLIVPKRVAASMYSDFFLVGFPCLVAVFFFGWCVGGGCGACVSYTGIPGSSMPWALQYLWAIKIFLVIFVPFRFTWKLGQVPPF